MHKLFLHTLKRGRTVPAFTLIEMLVAVALFIVIMIIALGALLGIVDADSRAQSVGFMANNVDFVFDDMSRNLSTGIGYSCGGGVSSCFSSGSDEILFTNQEAQDIGYEFSSSCIDATTGNPYAGYVGGCVEKSMDGGSSWTPITSADVYVDDLQFYVNGGEVFPDRNQPTVFIRFTAHLLGTKPGTNFYMHLQTTVTQRIYDN